MMHGFATQERMNGGGFRRRRRQRERQEGMPRLTTTSLVSITLSFLVFVCKSHADEIIAPASASASASTRIIGGFETADTRYTYAVSLSYFGEHFCGGALIAPDVVISAGHCNSGGLPIENASIEVVVGRHDISLSSSGTENAGEILSVAKEIRHPNYDPETVDNDFNLIFLNGKASSETVYLRLNGDNSVPYSGEALTVVGWGDTNADPDITTTSNVLMETTVFAMTNEVCQQASGYVNAGWGDDGNRQQVLMGMQGGITENMMCAQAYDADACQVRERWVNTKGVGWNGKYDD